MFFLLAVFFLQRRGLQYIFWIWLRMLADWYLNAARVLSCSFFLTSVGHHTKIVLRRPFQTQLVSEKKLAFSVHTSTEHDFM